MPAFLPADTRQALGDDLRHCNSRSLFQDRFADPQATDQTTPTRKQWFNSLLGRKAEAPPSRSSWFPPHAEIIYARLMSRLMVNLAGGVMENANIALDRYGLPIIPGSAVKGCARRMALQALHDWPESPSDEDDPTAPCREGFGSAAEMLASIARVFGWTSDDWKLNKKDGYFKSDFAWAVHGNADILAAAKSQLPSHESFAGTIAFLSASPDGDPGLELDVVTPHHTKYYQNERGYESAPDTEEPVPVFFPAVRPQAGTTHYFSFPLIPLRLATQAETTQAKRWLQHGLEIFGLGAKTNAGYGWFLTIEGPEAPTPDALSGLMPPLPESEQFLKGWGGKKLNSFSIAFFAKMASKVSCDSELLLIFKALCPDKIESFNPRDPFWSPFLASADGKAVFARIKNKVS